MKQNNFTENIYGRLSAACGLLFVVAIFLITSCNRTEELSYQVQDRKVLMFDQLKSDTSMSIAAEALERANLAGALDSYGRPVRFFGAGTPHYFEPSSISFTRCSTHCCCLGKSL